VINDD